MKLLIYIVLVFVATIELKAQSVGGNTSGSTAYCNSTNSGFVSLSGYTGAILRWESSINNGLNWINLANPTSTQSYSNLNQTTWYRAIVKNGGFPQDTSTISVITVHQPANGGTVAGGGSFCQTAPAGILNLTGHVGQVMNWEYSTNASVSWTVLTNTLSNLPYSAITQNTLYRAIIRNVASCPTATSSVASFSISQNTVAGNLLSSDTVCSGFNADTLKLSGQTGSIVGWIKSTNGGTSWANINNLTNSFIYSNITQTTNYAVIIKNGVCPADTTQPVKILVVNANLANAGPDKSITQYETVQLGGSGFGIPEWTPVTQLNDPDVFTPVASPLHTTTYVLTLTDKYGCMSTDSVLVNVFIPVPTAITPNEDGVNDYFMIDKIEDYPSNVFTVYNRWGNIVYKASPYLNDWNGKSKSGHDLPDEVYYYLLDYGVGEKAASGYILIKR
jgi:gliding motility-associated-like protein